MNATPVDVLKTKAQSIRESIITMLATAGSGHAGGALGMADVFATLYFDVLQHQPQTPESPERDRLLLSNGHICPVLYATLAEAGYFPKDELATLRRLNSRLQGHPHLGSLPGVENTGGPLGQGISQACGVALGFKLDKKPNHVYCVMSDGEHNEGQTWEAYLFGHKYRLNNLTLLIDRNHIQIDGRTEDIMPLEPFAAKIAAFGWQVLEIDGHDVTAIRQACLTAKATLDLPTAIICHTVPGKGVDFMENKYEWHGKAPTPDEAAQALSQLRYE
jgi:transketolase